MEERMHSYGWREEWANFGGNAKGKLTLGKSKLVAGNNGVLWARYFYET